MLGFSHNDKASSQPPMSSFFTFVQHFIIYKVLLFIESQTISCNPRKLWYIIDWIERVLAMELFVKERRGSKGGARKTGGERKPKNKQE